ncbi:Rv3235 family protein [Streptomyces sp. NPDC086182]|uniref:Rv3235 family protein n=1 Tax=Streptomyces sp. NPDC086182 TaxID=3155058 RepID=UPI00343FFF15
MNKVMTRTRRHPGTRPPGRQDTRRPGGTPPRTPGRGTPAGPPGGSPPQDTGSSPTRPASALSAPRTDTGHAASAVAPAAAGSRSPAVPAPATGAAAAARHTGHPATGPGGSRSPATARGGARPLATASAEAPRSPAPQPRPTDVFAERLLAVLSGARPVHCMLRHTAGRAYDELAWLAERGPLRTRGTRPVVRDIGYYVARPGAVEAFARIGAGDQLRAMAFRLEQGPDLRWRCTAIELGGPRMPRAND